MLSVKYCKRQTADFLTESCYYFHKLIVDICIFIFYSPLEDMNTFHFPFAALYTCCATICYIVLIKLC